MEDTIVDIIIPSCKTRGDMRRTIQTIESTRHTTGHIIFTGMLDSASVNRNDGLNKTNGDVVIMVDDDIVDYYTGWDKDLVDCLLENEDLFLVSARLLNKDRSVQPINSDSITMQKLATKHVHEYITMFPDEIEENISYATGFRLPMAAVCFRNTELRFDENFTGSGFEDTDFTERLARKNHGKRMAVLNSCRLTHLNEMKNQSGENHIRNSQYFHSKMKEIL